MGITGPTRWTKEQENEMKRFERGVIDLALSQNVNPILGLYALVRIARVLLRKGDRESQNALLPVIKAYLEGRTSPPGEHPFLWLPGDQVH